MFDMLVEQLVDAATGVGRDVQRADVLGRVEFVAGQRQQIHLERLDINCDLARRLRGVSVQQDAPGPGQRHNLGHRLNRADRIVGMHDRHQRRVRCRFRRVQQRR